ncbi:class I SAM-dependent methyltransferase [Streptomyces carpaticus]|uniref:class I SAM-dependent methyltransferase n=1 Tax=Streptomyces carpaticus TaxID=285558 RepID=UPI0031F7CBD5
MSTATGTAGTTGTTGTAHTPGPPVEDSGYGRVFASFYDRIFPKDGYADRAARQLADWHPGGGALEFGAGTGRIAVPLARLAGPVTGVDSSPEMLTLLREAVAEAGVPVTPVHADIRTYRDDRHYGLVYCVCATLSILLRPEEQRAAVARAAARLAPGGSLVIETHNPAFVHGLHEGRRRTAYFTPYPWPGTGLQTYSTLHPEANLWEASHIWHENGGSHVGREVSRLTAAAEVDAYAADAGLVLADRLADWTGGPYREDGPMHISRYVHAQPEGAAHHDDAAHR